MTERRAWIPASVVLAVAYFSTLAPTVTFWDAGEFIAAAHSLGIPHPPGTPLFILLLHVWGMPWPDSAYAMALNAASAVATTGAAALSAMLVFRWLRTRWDAHAAFAGATAAAICAGAMYTVWSSATETEVYAASLVLAVATLFAADRRQGLLVAYCFGLASALHVSALVAAPAAILLCASREEETFDFRLAVRLAGASLAAMAIGTWNPWIGIAAASVIVASINPRSLAQFTLRSEATNGLRMTLVVILGASPLLFMLVRAQFDPGVNQGNPSTLGALTDVIGRRQYELAPLWPRRAPLWIQLGNWFEYADWQAALSLGPGVVPTVQRTVVSLVFGALAIYGASHHRRVDRRSWRALLALFIAGTVGVTLYLNLRASPSFGWGVLPADALREARERDYFFVLGFWAVGLWAGMGAMALARARRIPGMAGVMVASLPIALNWSAVNRRAEPDAYLAEKIARGLVTTLPPRTVLFVAGDNDSYPVWFTREVFGLRPDVTLVTVPLIGAGWYVEELIRRNSELSSAKTSEGTTARTIADAARAADRPVAASITLEKRDRILLNGCWTVIGIALLDSPIASNCLSTIDHGEDAPVPIDSSAVEAWIRLAASTPTPSVKPSVDPVAEYFARVLNCPRELLAERRKTGRGLSLDSTCKL